MVCYARPVTFLAATLIVAWLAFSGPVSHFFATAAILVAALVAAAGAAAAVAVVLTAAMSARRRRSAGGGCVSCRFRCQHAMTGLAPGRHQGPRPARSAPVLLPVPEVGAVAPRWPDRPIYRTVATPQRERAGSSA